jgi:heat shock protein HslJ
VSERKPNRDTPVAGTSWVVDRVAGHPTVPDRRPEMTFDHGGRVVGSTGINRFTGTYVVVGDELSFGPLAVTRRSGPPELVDQQQRLLGALARPSRVRVSGDRLDLVHDGATSRLTRVQAPASPRDRPGTSRWVRGTVTYPERVAPPAGSVLTVYLRHAGDDRRVLAQHVIDPLLRVPSPFQVEVPAGVGAGDRLEVIARITAGGSVMWHTHRPVAASPGGSTDQVHLVLRRRSRPRDRNQAP